jgi:hypothetical protein
LTSQRISLRIHHNGKSTDFEQTLGPGTTINLNALTCYGLRFVERRPGDQSGTWGGLILGDNARAPYLAACDAVAAAPLMDWIMSPSSGQAIILCWLNQQSVQGSARVGFQRVVQHVSTQEP